ncbi:hypothetical protein [Streptomyces sp. NPDC015350]|uniref:hypothetical protein n=1 Tax=Streptomyces sp. NPDC015350 TaxID=3364955 RepID=UPI0036F9EBB7
MRSRPPVLIAAPDGPHPALSRVTADPRYGTPVVRTGENVLRALYEHRPDDPVLNLRLPGLDPREKLGRMRDTSGLPIAVVDLTYRVADAARTLEAGADDHLTPGVADPLHAPPPRARLRSAVETPRRSATRTPAACGSAYGRATRRMPRGRDGRTKTRRDAEPVTAGRVAPES